MTARKLAEQAKEVWYLWLMLAAVLGALGFKVAVTNEPLQTYIHAQAARDSLQDAALARHIEVERARGDSIFREIGQLRSLQEDMAVGMCFQRLDAYAYARLRCRERIGR